MELVVVKSQFCPNLQRQPRVGVYVLRVARGNMLAECVSGAACHATLMEVMSSLVPVLLEFVLPSARAGTSTVRPDPGIRVAGCISVRETAMRLLEVMWRSRRVRAVARRVAGSQSAAVTP